MITASFQPLVAHAELVGGVLRLHPNGGSWRERSAFDWACTMLIRGTDAELWGATAPTTSAQRKAIRDCCRELGVRRVRYEVHGRLKTHIDHIGSSDQ